MKKSIFLFFAAILCSVSAWSYNYGGTNVYYYFANTGSWSNVYLYIWNSDNTWNTNFTLNKIANTNVYYHTYKYKLLQVHELIYEDVPILHHHKIPYQNLRFQADIGLCASYETTLIRTKELIAMKRHSTISLVYYRL